MNEDIKRARALKVYADICKALDNDNWRYDKKEDQLQIYTSATSDNLTVQVTVVVHSNIERVQMYSQFPFTVPEDKKIDMAIAVAHLQTKLAYGGFDYNISTGDLYYNIGNTYAGAVLSEKAITNLLGILCYTVDKFYAKLMALTKGYISLTDILKED